MSRGLCIGQLLVTGRQMAGNSHWFMCGLMGWSAEGIPAQHQHRNGWLADNLDSTVILGFEQAWLRCSRYRNNSELMNCLSALPAVPRRFRRPVQACPEQSRR